MIRRIAFGKAIVAGAAGALAWEAVARTFILTGIPLFDLVRVLGLLAGIRESHFWLWWPVGMAMHALVGSIWAVFYAYFFWSILNVHHTFQGVAFSLLPAALAGLIMVPQMDLMLERGAASQFRLFALALGWLGPFTIIAGHLIYGAVLGGLYHRPVGYPVGREVRIG
jgi:hypothetical protein